MTKDTIVKVLKYLLGGILSLIILGIVAGGLLFFYYVSSAPELSETVLKSTASSLIYDNQDNLIADLGAENRENVEADNIPLNLVEAVIAIEDHRFFQHRGIDIYRIVGAAINNLRNSSTQGGSTLDQQLIKLAYFSTDTSDQTLKRKAQEAWLALKMEQQYTKEEILTFYINKVFMGNGNYGMLTAAKSYFNKDLKDLSVAQVALLAGIPQAPSTYNPYTNPEGAKERRDIVIGQMLKYGYITQEEHDKAIATPISDGLQPLEEKFTYPKSLDNYLTQVIDEVQEKTGLNLFTAGLRIYTNLDQGIQNQLWNVTNTYDYIYYSDDDFQVASTIVDVNTGAVVAQIGGRNQDQDSSFGTNQAVLTDRDWGSTMKPITDYAPAIEHGIYNTTGQILSDTLHYWPGTSTQIYNWDRQYFGNITMQQALAQSRNIPAVRALEAVGLDNALNFLNGVGINYPELYYSNAISSNTSVVDSNYGASSEKMATAYAAFANGGTYYKPQYVRRIEFNDGTVTNYEAEGNYAMSATTAYMMTDMLKTVMTNNGTSPEAAISGVYHAGKSGTSNYSEDELDTIWAQTGLTTDNVGTMAPDELFVGYTNQYSVAIWTGYKNRLTPLFGENLNVAKYVYRAMMSHLVNTYGNTDFIMPAGLYRNGSYLYLDGSTAVSTQTQQDTSQWNNQPNNTQVYSNQTQETYETVTITETPNSQSSETETSTEANTNTDTEATRDTTATVTENSSTSSVEEPASQTDGTGSEILEDSGD